MARVKGPNGLILDLPDGVATDLVNSPSGEYRRAEDEAPAKKAASKPSKK